VRFRLLRAFSGWLSFVWDMLRLAPAARWVAFSCTAVFCVQRVCQHVEVAAGVSFGAALLSCFGLCPSLLASGFVWQIFTYMFLHGSWIHLLLNMLTLLLFGAGLEAEIGSRNFMRVFLLGGVVGGVVWAGFDFSVTRLAGHMAEHEPWVKVIVSWLLAQRGAPLGVSSICVGASGGVFALIGAFAAIFPRREVILFVGWPLRLRARTVAVLLGLVTVVFGIYGLGNVAYLTHLSGGLAGYWCGLRMARHGFGDDTDEQSMDV